MTWNDPKLGERKEYDTNIEHESNIRDEEDSEPVASPSQGGSTEHNCGCTIRHAYGIPYIVYCPKHNASPLMYQALQFVEHWFEEWSVEIGPAEENLLERVRAAFAAADSGEKKEGKQ